MNEEELRDQLAKMYSRTFPSLTCMTCMRNALNDAYIGQITDDEELDELHTQRRTKLWQREWEQRCLKRQTIKK